MDTNDFAKRVEEVANQVTDLIREIEKEGIVEEQESETQGKIKVSHAIKRMSVNIDALEHVSYKKFRSEKEEEQLNG